MTTRPPITTKTWTPAKTKRAKSLWWLGWSGPRIAADLGGVTEKAVRSKARHECWDRNPEWTGHKRVKRPNAPTPPRPVALPIAPNDPPPVLRGGEPITLVEVRDNECHWIAGLPGADAQLCGHKTVKGKYCRVHAGRMFQPEHR